MGRYMNSQEQQVFLTAWATLNSIISVIKRIEGKQPKRVVGDFKRAKYYIDRANKSWTEDVDKQTQEKLNRRAASSQIGVFMPAELKAHQIAYGRYMRDLRNEVAADGNGRDMIFDVSEVAMSAVCHKCDGKVRETCQLYPAFEAMHIEAWEPNHKHCVYAGTGEVGA